MADDKPLKLALLWHMHQPNYQEPGSRRMVLPWVRLHATKDYLDMPLIVGEFENVKVTFNLVPSLLDQLDLYLMGGTDPHLELSRIPADQLTSTQKTEIIDTFFDANPVHMIDPYRRFSELYRKAKEASPTKVLPSLFSSEEMRDLQVWSNLAWVDPLFRSEEPARTLFAQGKQFTEQQKQDLLDWQQRLMERIVPTYRDMYTEGKIDVSFTPYYHPILPLLCDTDVALEASPSMELPQERFRHPEDARRQVRLAADKFQSVFGSPLVGMWPSEGGVSEEVADIMIEAGIRWAATDEEILSYSLRKSKLDVGENPLHTVYEYGDGLKLLFRDHALSDRIGFVYSGWDADKAAADFVDHLRRLGLARGRRNETLVVPVILDGENAWEYFPNDGQDFLRELYGRIQADPDIETVTISDAVDSVPARKLPSLFAGSWINHNFRIWIGHHEDNAAWDYLSEARRALVEFQEKHPDFDPEKISSAWKQIYIAEGSDWCWWYGDEHRGHHNERFDYIFRRHLMAVYELLDLEVPFRLMSPIYRAGAGLKAILPDALLTPTIDGRLTGYYEWSSAGYFDCLKAGAAMHRVDQCISKIYFVYDHDRFYIRLDFVDRKGLESLRAPALHFAFFTPEPRSLELPLPAGETRRRAPEGYEFGFADLLELGVERTYLWPDKGFGELGFTVTFVDGDSQLETWPGREPIKLKVAQKGNEMFWPT